MSNEWPREKTIDLGYGLEFVLCESCSEKDQMDVFHPRQSDMTSMKMKNRQKRLQKRQEGYKQAVERMGGHANPQNYRKPGSLNK